MQDVISDNRDTRNPAPGGPGIFSPWTSGAKTGIGRSINAMSAVSFTIGKGVLNEVYFPQEDMACIRECIFLVADGGRYFSDERTANREKEEMAEAGIPAYIFRSCPTDKGYVLDKEIVSDSNRNTVLQRVRFKPSSKESKLYVTLTPHLDNQGADNEAWVGDFKGMEMLFAHSGGLALAMASSSGWAETTVGFIGASDGLTDLRENKRLTRLFDYAGRGNVQLCARPCHSGELVIAIGFGFSPEEAAFNARASLLEGFGKIWKTYADEWRQWLREKKKGWRRRTVKSEWLPESVAALRIAESRKYPGGIIASLSIPWGEARGVNDGLGYHFVWPRDLVESAWAFLALNATEDVMRIVNYLFTTQDADGKWPQNMWLDGRACLQKIQMDQVALPILLIYSCIHRGVISGNQWRKFLPGIRRAALYLLKYGPFSQEDRWEQQSGFSSFTIAAVIAGLVAAARLFEQAGDTSLATECLRMADEWNQRIEEWTFVRGTDTARRCRVSGYYIRVNPFDAPAEEVKQRPLHIHHRPPGSDEMPLGEIVSVDALALVRFGLRRADDPRILDTIRVIDDQLKNVLPGGPCWHRFSCDGYGENDAGEPLGRYGKGRCWPLLTGERAHYEIAAGRWRKAKKLFRAMEAFSHNGFLAEQVWDAPDIPQRGLYCGKFTGSAMPLTWAQAEYIKLAVSLRENRIFDLPSAAARRYLKS
ncbi:MAG TPA: glycoside hydrolase family 15 protein [Puia sp.]|uniref:glycoside hydrolase family 15 protein n=1 Tax=Puia sp. TaxID=2045100 RepID=UPI002C53D2F5|nr:glycoside hydrolase family 15 protein [Puia sp.]HVU94259.1 glycoside hydrolase family 15 protein [Puia sp.]